MHPYDAHTGEQCHDWRIYARIIEGIRAGCDALVYPTITSAPGAPWMAAGLGVDILPLIPHIVARGGHLRVGLEDAPWQSMLINTEWVRRAAAAVREAGSEPASPDEVRAALAALDAQ